MAAKSGSEKDVKTVTAVIDPLGSASTAALIILLPPAAWTVKNFGDKDDTDSTAPFTVFGMSYNLRSRNNSKSLSSLSLSIPCAP